MPSLTIRNIPAELYDEFKHLASEEHRSLNAEAIAVFDRAVHEHRLRMQRRKALESIILRFPEKPSLPVDGATLLREDRDR